MDSGTVQGPIFIVGSPRSGTTLMREILNRHPSIAILGETHFVPLVYARRKAFGDLADPIRRRRLIDEYLVNRHIQRTKLDTVQLAERLAREATSYRAMFWSMLAYNAEIQGKRRVGEKSPQHGLYLEMLREWFPDALIVHMVRDPRASVASMLHMPWSRGSVMSNALQWMRVNRAACRFRGRPGYLEVRYEALVTDPAAELDKVCAFLGEKYSPLMLGADRAFSEEGDTGERAGMPITSGRADAWRQELTPAQVAQIEWVVRPMMEMFGYTPEARPASAVTVLRGAGQAALGYARFVLARLPAVWYRFAAPAKLTKYDYWTGPRVWSKRAK